MTLAIGSFGGKPLLHPLRDPAVMQAVRSAGYLVNSYHNPRGAAIGTGTLLMRREDFDALDRTSSHTLRLKQGADEINISLFISGSAYRLLPGRQSDPNAPLVVPVADIRLRMASGHMNRTYTVLRDDRQVSSCDLWNPDTDDDNDVRFTVQSVLNAVWGQIPFVPHSAPSLPNGYTPEWESFFLWFVNTSPWEAYNRLAFLLGLDVCYDHTANTFTLEQTAKEDSALLAQETLYIGRRFMDTESSNNSKDIPGTLKVCFQEYHGDRLYHCEDFSIDDWKTQTANAYPTRYVSSKTHSLFNSQTPGFRGPFPSAPRNQVDLKRLVTMFGTSWYQHHIPETTHRQFSEALPFKPGSQVSSVSLTHNGQFWTTKVDRTNTLIWDQTAPDTDDDCPDGYCEWTATTCSFDPTIPIWEQTSSSCADDLGCCIPEVPPTEAQAASSAVVYTCCGPPGSTGCEYVITIDADGEAVWTLEVDNCDGNCCDTLEDRPTDEQYENCMRLVLLCSDTCSSGVCKWNWSTGTSTWSQDGSNTCENAGTCLCLPPTFPGSASCDFTYTNCVAETDPNAIPDSPFGSGTATCPPTTTGTTGTTGTGTSTTTVSPACSTCEYTKVGNNLLILQDCNNDLCVNPVNGSPGTCTCPARNTGFNDCEVQVAACGCSGSPPVPAPSPGSTPDIINEFCDSAGLHWWECWFDRGSRPMGDRGGDSGTGSGPGPGSGLNGNSGSPGGVIIRPRPGGGPCTFTGGLPRCRWICADSGNWIFLNGDCSISIEGDGACLLDSVSSGGRCDMPSRSCNCGETTDTPCYGCPGDADNPNNPPCFSSTTTGCGGICTYVWSSGAWVLRSGNCGSVDVLGCPCNNPPGYSGTECETAQVGCGTTTTPTTSSTTSTTSTTAAPCTGSSHWICQVESGSRGGWVLYNDQCNGSCTDPAFCRAVAPGVSCNFQRDGHIQEGTCLCQTPPDPIGACCYVQACITPGEEKVCCLETTEDYCTDTLNGSWAQNSGCEGEPCGCACLLDNCAETGCCDCTPTTTTS